MPASASQCSPYAPPPAFACAPCRQCPTGAGLWPTASHRTAPRAPRPLPFALARPAQTPAASRCAWPLAPPAAPPARARPPSTRGAAPSSPRAPSPPRRRASRSRHGGHRASPSCSTSSAPSSPPSPPPAPGQTPGSPPASPPPPPRAPRSSAPAPPLQLSGPLSWPSRPLSTAPCASPTSPGARRCIFACHPRTHRWWAEGAPLPARCVCGPLRSSAGNTSQTAPSASSAPSGRSACQGG
mmetsp:Transcript_21666/g.47597  ORF Transcript_21666/g.47597 Transcript_21666/m.47597 type:complete len:241 (-) Transcript_21666:978-1700(-)